jgi:hypothetical protein
MCFPWSIGARLDQAKCYGELMQMHEKPKGRGEKFSTAGLLCKIGEGNGKPARAIAARPSFRGIAQR